MAEFNVESVYATALLGAVCDNKVEDAVMEEASEILHIMKAEPSFLKLLASPSIAAADKHEVLENVFGGKIHDELFNFMCILVDKRRFLEFPAIIRVFRMLLEKKEGFLYGRIYSTVQLSQEQMDKFEAQTGKLLRANVKLDNELDANLIGGIKIMIDGKIIDASYRKQLEQMAYRMLD